MPRTTRREFLGRAAAGAAAMALAPGAFAQQYPPGKYVDVHTHITHPEGVNKALDVAGLLAWMDLHEISQAVVLPLISPESWDHPISTNYVLEQTKPHRDRLIPFCSIEPRTSNLNYQGRLDMLRRYQDAGAKGFEEHKPGVAMDSPGNLELFRACSEVGFPVLFHLDNIRNTDAPGLPALDRVLSEFPDCAFIGHAPGWWSSISGDATEKDLGGYPKTPVAPGGAIDALMEQHTNLYGDLSAGSGANAILRDKAFGREFLIRRADRLLFGTDYLKPEQDVPQVTMFGELDLPEAVAAKIFRENARKLLSL